MRKLRLSEMKASIQETLKWGNSLLCSSWGGDTGTFGFRSFRSQALEVSTQFSTRAITLPSLGRAGNLSWPQQGPRVQPARDINTQGLCQHFPLAQKPSKSCGGHEVRFNSIPAVSRPGLQSLSWALERNSPRFKLWLTHLS
jgi:hypothetical protein